MGKGQSFQQIVLEKLDIRIQKNESELLSYITELLHDPAIPILDIHSKDVEAGMQTGIYTLMFIEVCYSQ